MPLNLRWLLVGSAALNLFLAGIGAALLMEDGGQTERVSRRDFGPVGPDLMLAGNIRTPSVVMKASLVVR